MGNEFSSVEALWSTFENVMGKEEEEVAAGNVNDNAASGATKRETGKNEDREDEAGIVQTDS